jgi:hypothetical protein
MSVTHSTGIHLNTNQNPIVTAHESDNGLRWVKIDGTVNIFYEDPQAIVDFLADIWALVVEQNPDLPDVQVMLR